MTKWWVESVMPFHYIAAAILNMHEHVCEIQLKNVLKVIKIAFIQFYIYFSYFIITSSMKSIMEAYTNKTTIADFL